MGVTRAYTLKGNRDKVYSRVVKKMERESSLVKAGAVSDLSLIHISPKKSLYNHKLNVSHYKYPK